MIRMAQPLGRDCEMCGEPIRDYPYQDRSTVRVDSPFCASKLARKEHPDLRGWERSRPAVVDRANALVKLEAYDVGGIRIDLAKVEWDE